ncbi:MAG: HAD family hydrolase [Sphaerochaetaceae bacterium]|nr:HAD family hydrolase [Sphaerochaetaceae bacterium]
MTYKAICFDVDGTLYPKRVMNRKLFLLWLRHPLFTLKYNRMRKTFRLNQHSFEQELSLKDREAAIILTGYAKESPAFIERLRKNKDFLETRENLDLYLYKPMEAVYKRLKPCNGVKEAFIKIKEKGLKIGVFSDFPLFNKIEAMKLDDFVDCKISSLDVGFLKPHNQCLCSLLYNMGLKPSEVLYVGDSPSKDIAGAVKAGLDGVLVNWKGKKPEGAKGAFKNWHEFSKWLDEALK